MTREPVRSPSVCFSGDSMATTAARKAPAKAIATASAKAYSYLRFSTPEQGKGDSHRRQTQLAADFALRRGLTLDTELTFHDLGVSAFRGTNRVTGALGAFLNAVLTGAVPAGSFLLIESIDRLSRQSAWDALPTLQAIVNADITLATLTPEREISRKTMADNPFLLMEVLIYMTRANEESATKSRRVKAVWQNKRTNAPNRVMTAWCPSWLTLNKDNDGFVIVAERAEVIRWIFAETLKGRSPDSIVKALNDKRKGSPVFGRGKHWHRSFIDRLLRNDTLIGTLTPHSISYSGGRMVRDAQTPVLNYYPAVIDTQTFQRVQSLREGARSPMRGKNASKEVSNVFGGGMARCGRCGGSLVRVNKGKSKGIGVYLVCSAAKVGAGCTYEAVRYHQVEDAFLADVPRLVMRAPVGIRHKNKIDKEIDALEAAIEGTVSQLHNLLDSLARSPSAIVEERIREGESSLEEMQVQLAQLQRKRADASSPIVQSRLNDLLKASQAQPLDRNHLNALLRQNVALITLDFDTGALLLDWKQGGSAVVAYEGRK
jgi:DNA invertase Pin-like site-specific DNA recombinase